MLIYDNSIAPTHLVSVNNEWVSYLIGPYSCLKICQELIAVFLKSKLVKSGKNYWIIKFIEDINSNFLRKWFKGTNGRQKIYEIFHVYCIFYSSFMCQTTVIFGITKDGSLESNILASWNCFTCRNLFQNGANDMSECLTFETAFWK